ncbi:aminopeptidase P family protein, partial [Chloroflexota bacterium]
MKGLPYDAQIFTYGEDPAEWPGVFRQAALAAGIDGRQVGVEPGRLRLLELGYLEGAAPEAKFISAEDSLAALRMSKEENEIAAMRQAAKIAQEALLATLPVIKPGNSERQVAAELVS